MTRPFGDRATFAVEVGEPTAAALRVVDLWAAGTWLTTDDNVSGALPGGDLLAA
jgi:hypothetical protein